MRKITLDFFGEKEDIVLPFNLYFLRKEIEYNYLLSPLDANEVIIKYIKDSKSIIISNDNIYKEFKKENINYIYLDISTESRIYLENFNEIKENESLIKKLEILKQEKKEIIEKNNLAMTNGKEKLVNIKNKITELNKEFNSLKIELNAIYEKNLKLKTEKENEINRISEILKIPLDEKSTLLKLKIHHHNKEDEYIKQEIKEISKKFSKKIYQFYTNLDNNEHSIGNLKQYFYEILKQYSDELDEKIILKKNENELIVHNGIICSKCGIFPIKGIRYICPRCTGINYCEQCHNNFNHTHPLLKFFQIK
jgi:chromosome segregation ATPase